MQFLIATSFAVISLVGVVSPCPDVCSCGDGMVDCRYRGLSSIPRDIPYNTIGYLDLSFNEISEIERGAFSYSSTFFHLDLSYNTISEIERGVFTNISRFTSIDLSYSGISKIERGAFDAPFLDTLNLNGNKITRVEAWFLDGMPRIHRVSMEYNNISFVSEKAFQNMYYIRLKMICGCIDNYPLWKWLRATNKLKQRMGCYDHIGSYMEDLVPMNFHNCSVTTSRTTASPASRTTATPSNRTTSTPTSRTIMITPSAARITGKKLEATTFVPGVVIGIAIGVGSLAACLLLFGVIWRLWRQSKEKGDKFEEQPDKIRCITSNTTV